MLQTNPQVMLLNDTFMSIKTDERTVSKVSSVNAVMISVRGSRIKLVVLRVFHVSLACVTIRRRGQVIIVPDLDYTFFQAVNLIPFRKGLLRTIFPLKLHLF